MKRVIAIVITLAFCSLFFVFSASAAEDVPLTMSEFVVKSGSYWTKPTGGESIPTTMLPFDDRYDFVTTDSVKDIKWFSGSFAFNLTFQRSKVYDIYFRVHFSEPNTIGLSGRTLMYCPNPYTVFGYFNVEKIDDYTYGLRFRLEVPDSYTGSLSSIWLYVGADFIPINSGYLSVYLPVITAYDPADLVGDKIDASIDKIIEGDGTPVPDTGKDDVAGAIDDIDNAQNEALGGKTDQQIQQEVDNALNFDMKKLPTGSISNFNLFLDNLLDCFGLDYQALVLLSLSLGLAAFIIGKRYSV